MGHTSRLPDRTRTVCSQLKQYIRHDTIMPRNEIIATSHVARLDAHPNAHASAGGGLQLLCDAHSDDPKKSRLRRARTPLHRQRAMTE